MVLSGAAAKNDLAPSGIKCSEFGDVVDLKIFMFVHRNPIGVNGAQESDFAKITLESGSRIF